MYFILIIIEHRIQICLGPQLFKDIFILYVTPTIFLIFIFYKYNNIISNFINKKLQDRIQENKYFSHKNKIRNDYYFLKSKESEVCSTFKKSFRRLLKVQTYIKFLKFEL